MKRRIDIKKKNNIKRKVNARKRVNFKRKVKNMLYDALRPEISIIIPVYNSEKYFRDTLDSVLAQTFKNFELILVDDGSPDRCGDICDEYAKKDKRIRVYHIANSGSSAARNYGIDRALGRYIGFVDSDDIIEPDMYEFLHDMIVGEDADVSMCGLADVYGGKVSNPVDKPVYKIMDAEEAIVTVFEAKLTSVTSVNKLFKREIIGNTRYPVRRDCGEDAAIIVELLMKCKKTVLCNEQKYMYIHREGSISTRPFRRSDLSVIEAYRKNYALIRDKYPDIIDVAVQRLCWAHYTVLDKLLRSDDRSEFKDIEDKIVRYLHKNKRYILKDRRFNTTRRIAIIALGFSVETYRLFLLLNDRRRPLAEK